MNVEFVLENTDEVITSLEIVYPPQVGNKVTIFERGSKESKEYRVVSVEFVQLDPDITQAFTKYGNIDVVGAICEVIPLK